MMVCITEELFRKWKIVFLFTVHEWWQIYLKLLTKGPNQRKAKSINFRKAFLEIDQVLETCIEEISTKNNLEGIL